MARSSNNFSILAEVELDTSTIQKQLNNLGSKLKFDSTTLKDAQKSMDDLGNSAEKAGDKVADTALNFNAANEIFQNTLDIIGSMVDQVYELDSALTEFKKVSDLQGQALQNYQNHLADLGSTVGRTTSEMIEAATEFRKNGFNDEDAAQLGQLATLYQNVADETISAGESASFLIAQMTAFDIDASGADHIVDAVNQVSNAFSVSSADISGSLGNMSAVMAQTGATFEESLGMLTAITEVTRSANKASRGLVSIGSRLVQIVDDSSSTGKALKEIYNELGIALYDSEGQLRSSYDIFYDLSQIWDTLDTNTQNYIASVQAGTFVLIQGELTGKPLELYLPNYCSNTMAA